MYIALFLMSRTHSEHLGMGILHLTERTGKWSVPAPSLASPSLKEQTSIGHNQTSSSARLPAPRPVEGAAKPVRPVANNSPQRRSHAVLPQIRCNLVKLGQRVCPRFPEGRIIFGEGTVRTPSTLGPAAPKYRLFRPGLERTWSRVPSQTHLGGVYDKTVRDVGDEAVDVDSQVTATQRTFNYRRDVRARGTSRSVRRLQRFA